MMELDRRRFRDETPEEARARYRAIYAANPGKQKARIARYRERNAEKLKADADAWRAANPDKVKISRKRHAASPKAKATHCAKMARRNAQKRNAMPPWADPVAIAAIYQEAARVSEATGIPHQVDHVVPITHPLICGLHVEGNLQILTAEANSRKGNKWPWSAE